MPYPLLSKDALEGCEIAEIVTGDKGQTYAEIRMQQPVCQLSATPQHSPFQAGVIQDDGSSTRINLELNIDEATQEILKSLDTYLEEQPKTLAPGKAYHKLVQKSGDWPPRLRCKVNTEGPGAARFWSDQASPPGQRPTSGHRWHNDYGMCVFPKLWLMGVSVGVICELRAAVIRDSSVPTDDFPL